MPTSPRPETPLLKDTVVAASQLLYPVPLAARVLGVSPRLVWTFVQRGEIRTRRIRNRVLIHRRELERFAARDHATTSERGNDG